MQVLEEKLARTQKQKEALRKKAARAADKNQKLSDLLNKMKQENMISSEACVALEKYKGELYYFCRKKFNDKE